MVAIVSSVFFRVLLSSFKEVLPVFVTKALLVFSSVFACFRKLLLLFCSFVAGSSDLFFFFGFMPPGIFPFLLVPAIF